MGALPPPAMAACLSFVEQLKGGSIRFPAPGGSLFNGVLMMIFIFHVVSYLMKIETIINIT
jgi:hypothetical protein